MPAATCQALVDMQPGLDVPRGHHALAGKVCIALGGETMFDGTGFLVHL